MGPHRLIKEKKAICIKMPTYFTTKSLNCDKSKLSDIFIIDGTLIYEYASLISNGCAKAKLGLSS